MPSFFLLSFFAQNNLPLSRPVALNRTVLVTLKVGMRTAHSLASRGSASSQFAPIMTSHHDDVTPRKDLLGRMSEEEKLTQLIGGIGGGTTVAAPSVGVPRYQYHNEGLHGLRSTCGLGDAKSGKKIPSTMFPQV